MSTGIEKVSVIVPALNEEKNIKRCIRSVKGLNPFEIIVVDGGSIDNTIEIAKKEGAKLISSQKGRGIQMNTGASHAKGDILLFLHADSVIKDAERLRFFLKDFYLSSYGGAFLRLKFDDSSILTRMVEFFANLRARLLMMPYGDNAIILKRGFFEEVGGFRNYPFLEDIDLVLRVRKMGKMRYIPIDVIASSRRLKKGYPFSPILVSLRNVIIALLFIAGVSPYKLIRFYR